MNTIIQGARLHHIAIQTQAWEASRHFYQDLLGMPFIGEFEYEDEKFAFFEIGAGSYIELYYPMNNLATFTNLPLSHFAIQCNNLAEVVARVREAGYKISQEATQVQLDKWNATIAFIKGINGETIELFQLEEPNN